MMIMMLTTRVQMLAWLVILIQLLALSNADPLMRNMLAANDDDDNSNIRSNYEATSGNDDGDDNTRQIDETKIDGDGYFLNPFVQRSAQAFRSPSRQQYGIKHGNRVVKKIKPIIVNGYSMDINIDEYRSNRRCDYGEICKQALRVAFECVCPKRTLCVGLGSFFEAKCSNNLAPYVWIQHLEETPARNKKFLVV